LLSPSTYFNRTIAASSAGNRLNAVSNVAFNSATRADVSGSACGSAMRSAASVSSRVYRLLDACYAAVKGKWEERFEARFGFWRGFVDGAVGRYLDCGILENGFARVRCGDCHKDMLVAFSCKGRGGARCPSCGAKRAAETANRLRQDVLESVGHAQWVFTVPKMLRPYFLRHRELLGGLCQAAWQTVREMMAAAAGEDLRPGLWWWSRPSDRRSTSIPMCTQSRAAAGGRRRASGFRCPLWMRRRPSCCCGTKCFRCFARRE
jgi:hypothetical protein